MKAEIIKVKGEGYCPGELLIGWFIPNMTEEPANKDYKFLKLKCELYEDYDILKQLRYFKLKDTHARILPKFNKEELQG